MLIRFLPLYHFRSESSIFVTKNYNWQRGKNETAISFRPSEPIILKYYATGLMKFPFLFKKAVGLSVSDRSIEVVELRKEGVQEKVTSAGRIELDPGVVEHGRIQNKEKLAQALDKVFAQAKPHSISRNKVIFGLPENQVYLHSFSVPSHDKSERKELIKKEVQTSIPLKGDALVYSYKVLSEASESVEILVAAANREGVVEWRRFFERRNIEVEIFDIETLATFRGVFAEIPKEPVCLIDIGTLRTTISIFDEIGLRYSYGLEIGGETFTKEIASQLRVSEEEAEELKKKAGLSDQDERIFPILIKVLQTIAKEVLMSFRYFKEQTGKDVKGVILVGGSSDLKGIEDYFSANLNLYVRSGKSVLTREQKIDSEDAERIDRRLYIQAIGLALRGLDKVWDERDPAISVVISKAGKTKQLPKDIVKQKSPQNTESRTVQSDWAGARIKQKFSFAAGTEENAVKKITMKKKILVLVLLGGLVLLGLAYWYRTSEKAKKAEELQAEIQETENLIDENEQAPTPDVSGGASEQALEAPLPFGEEEVIQEVVRRVKISDTPTGWLNVRAGAGTEYERVTRVYPEETYSLLEEMNQWYKIEIDEETKGWIFSEYAAEQIEIVDQIDSSLSSEIGKEEVEIPSVRIQETPTGWLRVREGAGTTYPSIMQVYPGENYSLLEESEGWYKIQIDEETTGWVFSEYAQIIAN